MNVSRVGPSAMQQAYNATLTQTRPVPKGGDGDTDDGGRAAAVAQQASKAAPPSVSGRLDVMA